MVGPIYKMSVSMMITWSDFQFLRVVVSFYMSKVNLAVSDVPQLTV